jgi:hypothetical protein
VTMTWALEQGNAIELRRSKYIFEQLQNATLRSAITGITYLEKISSFIDIVLTTCQNLEEITSNTYKRSGHHLRVASVLLKQRSQEQCNTQYLKSALSPG